MWWIALHLPQLSLEAFAATLGDSARERPVALVAEHRISAVNAAAAACGIQPGSKRATALALAGELLLGQADAERDAAALTAVAHAALAFTPAVALHDAQTVLLEVQGSLRLFGGLAALRQRLKAALLPLGHGVRSAAAPTPLGAALLARWPDGGRGITVDLAALHERLDSAPVWLLGPGREHWEALQGMGLHTLADLRRMPRGGVARRFGEALLDELDRAYGQRPDPRPSIEPPAVFETRLELFARADTTEQVLHGAAVLLARLVAWAGARQSRVRAFTLHMRHEPRHREREATSATVLRIELAQPALDPAHLQTLLRERLARTELAAPTLELRLDCHELAQVAPPNGELFASRGSEAEGLVRLLERLRARLGDERVHRLQAVADHRPERASRAVPAHSAVGSGNDAMRAPVDRPDRHDSPLPLQRPVWLLPEPLALAERDALPLLDGRPLQLLSGPERIEAGWWDGPPAARDYFIAEADDGSLVWIWRGRLPPVAAADGSSGWFLQGRFG
jgi:protein ImuB